MVDSNLTPTPNLTNRFTASCLGSLICYDLFAILVSCSSCVWCSWKTYLGWPYITNLKMRRLSPFFCYEKRISPFPLTSLLWTNKILLQYFTANRDRISIVENALNPPIQARYLRLHPWGWYGYISMRAEFYGCRAGKLWVASCLFKEGGDQTAHALWVSEL